MSENGEASLPFRRHRCFLLQAYSPDLNFGWDGLIAKSHYLFVSLHFRLKLHFEHLFRIGTWLWWLHVCFILQEWHFRSARIIICLSTHSKRVRLSLCTEWSRRLQVAPLLTFGFPGTIPNPIPSFQQNRIKFFQAAVAFEYREVEIDTIEYLPNQYGHNLIMRNHVVEVDGTRRRTAFSYS